jgi:purine-binding chemotaxis protein CheW
MGRMADARKRAREGKVASSAAGASEPQAPPPPPTSAAPTPSAPPPQASAGTDATSPAASAGARIALPASGLASDILALADAAAVDTTLPVAPAPPPSPAPGGTSHNLSFFSVPAQEQRQAAEVTEHLATFVLDREEYGLDVHLVQEIRRVTEITAVPRAPDFIRGVINLRGRILPVVDLKRKLALGQVELTRSSRIVVVRLRERLLGLLVDGASQVLKVPVSKIEPAPEEVLASGGDYIRGVAKLEDRLIILVDLLRILAQELREGSAVGASS